MRRVLIAALASLVIAGLVAPAVAAAPATDSERAAVPKVVVIVGPAGAATNRYRAQAKSAAALARKYTPDVTEIYSPNATWPAVREALQGASLVIYMGHGNGWPSKYRDSLYPAVAERVRAEPDCARQRLQPPVLRRGADRATTFAWPRMRSSCSITCATRRATRNPASAEGTPAQARQRVDNYAAGFIRAGAAAVIAEAYDSPNNMVKVVLGGKRSIEAAWRGAPSANGNRFAFESARSPGYVVQMDPERTNSGFSRSIVLKNGLAASDVLRSARGSANAAALPIDSAALVPSLAGTGVELAAPVIQGSTAAEGKLRFKIPFTIADREKLPAVAGGQRPLGPDRAGRRRSGRRGRCRGADDRRGRAADRRPGLRAHQCRASR